MTPRRIALQAQAPQPWRNGGGRTRELLRLPDGAPDDGWSLRLSIADIERDGPFSAFPGVRRWFAVLEGHGVELSLSGGVRRLGRDGPAIEFDGADAPGCRLVDGPTRDLNLMLRDGATGALHPVAAGVEWDAPFAARGLFALAAGLWRPRGGAPVAVAPGTLLWADDGAPARFEPASAAGAGPLGWWIGHSARHAG